MITQENYTNEQHFHIRVSRSKIQRKHFFVNQYSAIAQELDRTIKLALDTYHGHGSAMVRRSHMAMAKRTVLVGDVMCLWLNTMMISVLEMKVIAIKTGMRKP